MANGIHGGGISRRNALKRGAMVAGAAAWTVPIVQTIHMTSAFAQTISAFGSNCCDPKVDLRALSFRYERGPCLPVGPGDDGLGGIIREAQEDCQGAEPNPGDVYIIVSEKKPEDVINPDGSFEGKIYFAGPVSEGGVFIGDAAIVGDDKLRGLYISVWEGAVKPAFGDPVRQFIKLHVSCSSNLPIGEKYASFVLIECNAGGLGTGCCDQTDGDIVTLTMEYTGNACPLVLPNPQDGKASCDQFGAMPFTARIIATQEDNLADALSKPSFHDANVNQGDAYQIVATQGGENKLKSDTFIYVLDPNTDALLQAVKFHTSCSKPLDIGDEFGAHKILVCAGDPGQGGNTCCDETGGDIGSLTFTYTGAACADPLQNPQSGKASCTDIGPLPANARIIVTQEDNLADALSKPAFHDAEVLMGTDFTAEAGLGGENKLKSESFVFILDAATDELRQQIEFHTSCSQPIDLGDVFGAVTIVACSADPGGGGGTNCCEPDKPKSLGMLYTGATCDPNANTQDPGKFNCADFGPLLGAVRIVASGQDNLADALVNPTYFDGVVNVGDNFIMSTGNAGEDKFENQTFIFFLDPADDSLLQEVEFHLSCSQDLFLGDGFGAVTLVACSTDPNGGGIIFN